MQAISIDCCHTMQQDADSTEAELAQLLLTSGDCAKLMPDGSPAEAARVAELEAHLKVGRGWAALRNASAAHSFTTAVPEVGSYQ